MSELDYKESWAPNNWCFWTTVLEKTLESALDSKEIQPISPKGNQPWMLTGKNDSEVEAPILWPPDVKSWLTGKDPHAGKDWEQEEKGMTEDEMVRRHDLLNGQEFEQTLGNLYAEYIMRNTGLEEAHAGIQIAGRNIKNLRYADDTTLMAESV